MGCFSFINASFNGMRQMFGKVNVAEMIQHLYELIYAKETKYSLPDITL